MKRVGSVSPMRIQSDLGALQRAPPRCCFQRRWECASRRRPRSVRFDPGNLAAGPPIEKEQIATMASIMPALAVADIARSVRFYNEVLGFESPYTMAGPDGEVMHGSVNLGDDMIMFGQIDPANPHNQGPLGKGVALYTTVDDTKDIDALFAHAKSAGAQVVQEPTDQFWGHRDWTVTDPDGYIVTVSKVIKQLTEQEMLEAVGAGAPAD
jgi:PhnB protein